MSLYTNFSNSELCNSSATSSSQGITISISIILFNFSQPSKGSDHAVSSAWKGTAWTFVAICTVLVISFDSPKGLMYNDTILGAMEHK